MLDLPRELAARAELPLPRPESLPSELEAGLLAGRDEGRAGRDEAACFAFDAASGLAFAAPWPAPA
jgi:hypothetical protein